MLTRTEIEERLVVLDTPGFHDEPRKEREALETAQQLYERLAQAEKVIAALEFYAAPDTYFAIGFFPDRPCGEFIDDVSDCGLEWGFRPGKHARDALAEWEGK